MYDPAKAGLYMDWLKLLSDDPVAPSRNVMLIGESTGLPPAEAPDAVFYPESVSLGEVPVGGSAGTTVTVFNGGNAPLIVSSASLNTASAFKLSAPSLPISIEPSQSLGFYVYYEPTSLEPTATGTLDITTNDPDTPLKSIPLTAIAVEAPPQVPDIRVTPTKLGVGGVTIGSSRTVAAQIANVGTGTLIVDAISLRDVPGWSYEPIPLPLPLAPGATYPVFITFAPTGPGTSTTQLTVHSNDPDEATVTVLAAGSGVEPSTPKVELLPPSLDFGPVPVGRSAVATMSVRNAGTAAASIDDIALSMGAEGFSIAKPSLPATLAPDESLTFEVTFAPSREGTSLASIAVSSSDPANPTVSGLLGGIGSEPLVGALQVTKVADKQVVHVGDSIQYAITVTNTGNLDLTNVHVTDPKLYLDYTIPTLVRGASATVPMDLTRYVAKDSDGRLIHNVATATGMGAFGVVGPETGEADVAIIHPAIKLEKTVSPTKVTLSGSTVSVPVTYTYVITNVGDTALDSVALHDDKLGAILADGGLIGSYISLAPGESRTVVVPDIAISEPVHNVAEAKGMDSLGLDVRDSADADVAVDVVKRFVLRSDAKGVRSYFVRYSLNGSAVDLPLAAEDDAFVADVTLPYGSVIESTQFFAINGARTALGPASGPETVNAPEPIMFTYTAGKIAGHKFVGTLTDNVPAAGWTIKLLEGDPSSRPQ